MSRDPIPEGACLIIDPLPARRDFLCELLEPIVHRFGLSLTAAAAIRDRAVASDQSHSVVLIVLDATDPGNPYAYDTVTATRRCMPQARILVLSDARERTHDVLDAFRAGAHGFMEASTDPHLLSCALSLLLAGGVFYSPPGLPDARSSPPSRATEIGAS